MEKTVNVGLDELCPYVRKAGNQSQSSWKNRFRRIYDHQFMFCLKGRAHLIIEDTKQDIHAGDLVLIKPDRPHSFWLDEKDPGELLWVHFDFVYRHDVYDLEKLVSTYAVLFNNKLPFTQYVRPDVIIENHISFPEVMQPKNVQLIESIFRKIISCYQQQEFLWQVECRIWLLQLLKGLFNELHNHNEGINLLEGERLSDVIIRYINKNYQGKLTLKNVSKFLGLSEDYISKVFKKEMGENFSHYVNRMRLEKAKEFLINTPANAADIAEIVGFSDVFYFSKVMKQYEGLSPSRWREVSQVKKEDKINPVERLHEKICVFKRPDTVLVKPHTHENIELVYMQRGKGILTIGGETIPVSAGDLLFYNIGELHCLNSESEMTAINIQMVPQILDESLAASQNAVDILTLAWFNDFKGIVSDFRPKVSFKGKARIEMEFIVSRMLDEYRQKDAGYAGVLFGYLTVLFAKLFRQITMETKMNIREDMPKIADEVLRYIEKNYDKKISLANLAKKSFYNPSYFSSIFKDCFGVSPMQYINKKRLEKAMELLVSTEDAVDTIMNAVGFSDKKHFYSQFKHRTGLTPGDFRNKSKENLR